MIPVPPDPGSHAPGEQPERESDHGIAEQCMLYLLGELSPADSSSFERKLTTSADANRELRVQAELLCALAAPDRNDAVTHHHHHPDDDSLAIVERAPERSRATPNRVMIGITALAACIAAAVFGFGSPHEERRSAAIDDASYPNAQRDETLAIARAWAVSQIDYVDDEDWTVADREDGFTEPNPAEEDSFLPWMVAALAADAERSESAAGETSDG